MLRSRRLSSLVACTISFAILMPAGVGLSESVSVLNLTAQVTAHDGTTYCVAATWNKNGLLDEGRFEALYSSLLHSFH